MASTQPSLLSASDDLLDMSHRSTGAASQERRSLLEKAPEQPVEITQVKSLGRRATFSDGRVTYCRAGTVISTRHRSTAVVVAVAEVATALVMVAISGCNLVLNCVVCVWWFLDGLDKNSMQYTVSNWKSEDRTPNLSIMYSRTSYNRTYINGSMSVLMRKNGFHSCFLTL